jgi:hypothetical protein
MVLSKAAEAFAEISKLICQEWGILEFRALSGQSVTNFDVPVLDTFSAVWTTTNLIFWAHRGRNTNAARIQSVLMSFGMLTSYLLRYSRQILKHDNMTQPTNAWRTGPHIRVRPWRVSGRSHQSIFTQRAIYPRALPWRVGSRRRHCLLLDDSAGALRMAGRLYIEI